MAGQSSVNIGGAGSTSYTYNVSVGTSSYVSGIGGVALGHTAYATGSKSVALGYYSRANADNIFVCGAQGAQGTAITNVYFGSGVQYGVEGSNNTPTTGAGVAYTINGSGAGGTNQAGGTITISGGKGTGTGAPGDVIFSSSDAGASGTTLQTLANRIWIKGETGQLSVGTGSPNASALVQVESTTQGFLPPRMTTTERNAISSPAAGLVIFNTTTTKLECYDGATWQAAW